jgi:RNA polymerase sigma-70 factor (ECF subfamily)
VDEDEFIRGLVARHGNDLLAYVIGLTAGNRQEAEDVVQETLLRAWRHADTIDPSVGSVRGWLMRVARNIVIDRYRSSRGRSTEVLTEVADQLSEDDHSDVLVTAMVVRHALARLRPEQRAAIIEVYFYGRTAAQAAKALGIPIGTVKSRTYYGLLALRALLEEERRRE